MCKADVAIFRVRAGEGASSHPTYSPGSHTNALTHFQAREGVEKLHSKSCVSHGGQPPLC